MKPVQRWGVLWRSDNHLEGKREFVLWHQTRPLLFDKREEARLWIREHYGYLRKRSELQREPHGWKMPKAVKVNVIIEPI